MIDLKIDSTGDLVIENGDLVLVDESEEVAQSMTIRYRTWQTEWILDVSIGVPYLDKIFSTGISQQEKDTILKTVALSTPGVKDLIKYDYDRDEDTGDVTVTIEATTDDGDILVETTV